MPAFLGLAVLALGASVGALTGEVGQAAPSVIAPGEPIPGTSSNVQLVGHIAPPGLGGGTTPAGQYAALGIAGDCAYLARRNFNLAGQAENGLGVQIVNIANPRDPKYVGTVPGSVFPGSTARELRAIAEYRLLIILHYSGSTGGGVNEGPVSSGGSNVMQAYRLNSDCSATHLADYVMGPVRPHEFYVWLDPKRPGRVIAYITTPFGPPQMEVVDFSGCSAVGATVPTSCSPSLLTLWDGIQPQPNPAAIGNSGLGDYLHSLSVSPDGRTGYMAYWNGGFFTVDTSQVASGQANPVIVGEASTSLRDDWSQQNGPTGQGGDAHSAAWVPTDLSRTAVKPFVVLSDEDYLGIGDCPFGWLRIDQVNQVAPGIFQPVRVGSYGLPENAFKQEAAAVSFASKANGPLADPATCAGYNRDHPGFIAADKSWPGGQVPANTYSSHNPTTFPDLVLLTWYGGGFQVVNIADPTHPSQAGFYIPTPEPAVSEELDDASGVFLACYYPLTPTATDPHNCDVRQGADPTASALEYTIHPQVEGWSYPIVKDGLIYFVDDRNGLYIVKYTGAFAHEVRATRFAEGNSNQPG